MSNPKRREWFRAMPVYGRSPESVDADAGVIRGAAVTTEGEAKGHGVSLDSEFVADVVAEGNRRAKQGLKVRFGHPNMSSTALGTFLGRAKNFRVESTADGDVARADVFLSAEAADTPQGDLRGYVLRMAVSEPDAFGMSIVFTPGERIYRRDVAGAKVYDDQDEFRATPGPDFVDLEELHAADMVDDPAANPDGLFSTWSRETWAAQVSEFLDIHPEVYELAAQNPDVIAGFLVRYQSTLARRSEAAQTQGDGTMPETTNEFAAEAVEQQELETVVETVESETLTEPEAAEPVELEAAAETVPDPRDGYRQFVAEFGAELGGKYFGDGLSAEDARVQYVAHLRAENAALKAGAGSNPVGASVADDEAERRAKSRAEWRNKVGGALGAYAAALKLKQQ